MGIAAEVGEEGNREVIQDEKDEHKAIRGKHSLTGMVTRIGRLGSRVDPWLRRW